MNECVFDYVVCECYKFVFTIYLVWRQCVPYPVLQISLYRIFMYIPPVCVFFVPPCCMCKCVSACIQYTSSIECELCSN